jgi:hypothetical protein
MSVVQGREGLMHYSLAEHQGDYDDGHGFIRCLAYDRTMGCVVEIGGYSVGFSDSEREKERRLIWSRWNG